MIDGLPQPDRRLGGLRLRTLLGAWQHGGPTYRALADGVRGLVRAGALPLGTRMPSEREVADALGVSRTTVTAAYDLLREERFLVSRRGSGTVTTTPAGAGSQPSAFAGSAHDGAVDLTAAAPSAPAALHEACVDALDRLPHLLAGTGYVPLGLPVLRAAIAARYTRRGVPTTADQVLVTSGAQQALHLLMTAFVGPGDRVVVEHPTYPHAIEAARDAGGRPVPVPVGPDGLDLDLLESTVRQTAPRLVYLVPDHHNPTGTSLDAAGRARVRDLARRYRTTVVGDETLTDLTLHGPEPVPFAGEGTDALVVCVGSASKTFWGGLRIGWVRAHRDLVGRLAQRRGSVDIATSVLDQLVTTALLDRFDELLPARRDLLRTQRDALVTMLGAHLPGWQVPVPAGGLSTWVDLGAPVSTTLAALAHRHGVQVPPGPRFGVDGSLDDHLRVPFSAPVDALRRAVEGLAATWAGLEPGSAAPAGRGESLLV